MTTQSEALLEIVSAWQEMKPDDRLRHEARLWRAPVVCTPLVYELARHDAEADEGDGLELLRERGLIVVADDPQAEMTRLRPLRTKTTRLQLGDRPGARGRAHGKRGKRK